MGLAATDSCHIRISLLTCGSGEELFTTWGHSALRVIDSSKGTDIVYNYGNFDFDDPGFYIKFAKGNMQYFVTAGSFANFVYEYDYFKRSITEQELNLPCTEIKQIATALIINAREENKYYRYDFLYDNCSSRLRDIVTKNVSATVRFSNIIPLKQLSFWDLIHQNLDKNHQVWSRLGIDILLGSKMDIKASNNEAMFLPGYLMKGFDNAAIGTKKLVSNKKIILGYPDFLTGSDGLTPVVFFSILLIVIVISSINPAIKNNKYLWNIVDFLLYFITGLLGVLLLFLWFGRIDTICSNNYNVLWAMPFNAIVAFFINSKHSAIKAYWAANTILLVLLLLTWKWLPQELNIGLLPFVLLLLYRTFIRYRKSKS
jgi:hypothetical protein